ncbi:DNA topoisomerase 2-binding protein 1-A isoform X2 [Cylas formicarius]|nr:DNA topoisomerase 2-binding protein 1-A isoform X2 [Cylas formicarius]XP_060533165.1 DNA topoisomerase 2-binding protein 1-A isoform X2 [Cylas formicarius]
MLPSWVDHVWKTSQSSNVNGNSSVIIKKYKCPCFHKLKICTTGLTSKGRNELAELISKNGGEMVGKLNLNETDILICHGPNGTNSDKFRAARKVSHLYCVTVDWIYDSIEKGYALPHESYEVKAVTSTPTKGSENIDPNFSALSAIVGPNNTQRSQIDETATTPKLFPQSASRKKRKASAELVDNMDLKKIKGAGQFLDGCSIFVAGFDPEHRDKLNKIVNLSGATRYDEVSDRITHVIVGDASCPEVINIKTAGLPCLLVSVHWLLESVEMQRPAEEKRYLLTSADFDEVDRSELDSPISKKALNLLKTTSIVTENELSARGGAPPPEYSADEQDVTLQRYMKSVASSELTEDTLADLLKNNDNGTLRGDREAFSIKRPDHGFKPSDASTQVSEVSTTLSQEMSADLQMFDKLRFVLVGFDEESSETLRENIENTGGTVVGGQFKGIPDYAVVSAFAEVTLTQTVKQEVNEFWIIQCLEENALVDIRYYHKPMTLHATRPLKNCVVTLSSFVGNERQFLRELIAALGGVPQEQLSRKHIESKNVLASTHLVSLEASGKKYEAALKWNLPVVAKDWLLECARTGIKTAEKCYVLGNGVAESDESLKTPPREEKTKLQNDDVDPSKIKSSVGTPVSRKLDSSTTEKTPLNRIYGTENGSDTPETYSQVTPINKIVQDAIDNNLMPTPPSPKVYYPWDPKTPDTPLGAFIRPNPSPRLRKEMQRYVNSFPEFEPPKRRLSTPLSELKRRLMDKVMGRGEYAAEAVAGPSTETRDSETEEGSGDSHVFSDRDARTEKSETKKAIDHKLQKFQEMLMASGSNSGPRRSSRAFESTKNLLGTIKKNDVQSQAYTVGWDYGEESDNLPQRQVERESPRRVFMLSGIQSAERDRIAKLVTDLGGVVTNSANYDPSCTHLLCSKPGRNEKTLACVAAGKWVLHVSYVDKCVEAGAFLDEGPFEFGNPKSYDTLQYDGLDVMMQNVYHWRTEVQRRGYGAFNDMRAIVIAEKRDPIVKVIEAGGGVVVNVEPPFDDAIHATHCLLEPKMVRDLARFVPLAQQGIKCYSTIYIDHYLRRTIKDSNDLLVPELARYYQQTDDFDDN